VPKPERRAPYLLLPRPVLDAEDRALPVVYTDSEAPDFALFLALRAAHPTTISAYTRWVFTRQRKKQRKRTLRAHREARKALEAYRAWEDSGRPWPEVRGAFEGAREAAAKPGVPCHATVAAWSVIPGATVSGLTLDAIEPRGGVLGIHGETRPRRESRGRWQDRGHWLPVLGPGAEALRDARVEAELRCSLSDDRRLFPTVPRWRPAKDVYAACGMRLGTLHACAMRAAFEDGGIDALSRLTGWPYAELLEPDEG